MYEVIGTSASRALRVIWMLEELGVPYTHISAKPHSEEALSANPSGKIPALREGDDVICDSTAIMTYLSDKHGGLTAPAGTLARAQQDAVTQAILDDIDAVLWATARHSFILPSEHRVPAIKEPMKWEYTRNLARIEAMMQGDFVMGNQITLPDILLTHCLRWAAVAKFPAPSGALADYLDRMQARPAFQRAVALS